jgi:hypothetical protein
MTPSTALHIGDVSEQNTEEEDLGNECFARFTVEKQEPRKILGNLRRF